MRGVREHRRGVAPMVAAIVAIAGFAALPGSAELRSVREDGGAAFVGRGGYSADGLGQFVGGGTVQADVPAESQVVQAFLYGSYYFAYGGLSTSDLTITFDGTDVVLDELEHAALGPCCALRSARADVTEQVAAKVGTGGGITDFTIGNDPYLLDGVALVVIYSNPSLPLTTIAVMDGGAEQSGDITTFNFVTPINTTQPDFQARMSLGIGFSYQFGTGHICGTTQFSTVDVNGSRLTSCAGNFDDGDGWNGALITVGGVGDTPDNPPNPNEPGGEDDELYDLESYVSDGDTELVIETTNPSGDDIVFLAVISVTGIASVSCTEDGLDRLHDTPAEGTASGLVHGTLEPLVSGASSDAGMLVHQVNCAAVVTVEDAVDDALPGTPASPPRPGAAPGTAA